VIDLLRKPLFFRKPPENTILREASRSYGNSIQEPRDFHIDLSIARSDEGIEGFRACSVLVVSEITGEASIKLNSMNNPAFDLTKLRKFTERIKRVFLTNTAQTGLALTLTAGAEDMEVSIRDMEADIALMALYQGLNPFITPSDTLIASSDAEVPHTGTTNWTKTKEFNILSPGEYRTTFQFKHGGSDSDAHARIYKNGVAFGTQRTKDQTEQTYAETYTEDLLFEEGDLCQMYQKVNVSARISYVRNFRLKGTLALTHAGENPV